MSVIERYDMCVGGTHGGSHVVFAEMQKYIDQLNKNIANAIHYLSN